MKTLKQMIVEIYETSEKMSEQVIADKLATKDDPVTRIMVYRWRSGVTLETKHARHKRIERLHKKLCGRKLND